jgi:hypothetical protein
MSFWRAFWVGVCVGGLLEGKRWVSVNGMGRRERLRGRTTCRSRVFYTGCGAPIRRVYILAWSLLACYKLGPRKQIRKRHQIRIISGTEQCKALLGMECGLGIWVGYRRCMRRRTRRTVNTPCQFLIILVHMCC